LYQFFFGILFPKANLYLSSKSAQILSFYNILYELRDFLATTIKEQSEISTKSFYNYLVDFVDYVLPFIFIYREVLKRKNFSLLLNFQLKDNKFQVLSFFLDVSKLFPDKENSKNQNFPKIKISKDQNFCVSTAGIEP
jgi:hypothetical protein